MRMVAGPSSKRLHLIGETKYREPDTGQHEFPVGFTLLPYRLHVGGDSVPEWRPGLRPLGEPRRLGFPFTGSFLD
jgi:hypothetical protein